MIKRYCYGCGSVLQTENENKSGYIKENLLIDDLDLLCHRCYQMQHYSKVIASNIEADEFTKIVTKINDEKALYVYIVDIFDLSFDNVLLNLLKDKKVLLVINKIDVLPKAIKENKFVNYVKEKLPLKVIEGIATSAIKKYNIDKLLAKIEDYSQNNDVYVVGSSNVGKSSIINAILKSVGQNQHLISVNPLFGTTLQTIKIPIGRKSFLYDTPGIINQNNLLNYVNNNDLKKIIPQKEIRPVVYQLNEKQAVFIENIAIIAFESGEKSNFIIYTSNRLKTHRTKLSEIERVNQNDKIFDLETNFTLDEMEKTSFLINGKEDILISGLGFVVVNGSNLKISIYTKKGVNVESRKALI